MSRGPATLSVIVYNLNADDTTVARTVIVAFKFSSRALHIMSNVSRVLRTRDVKQHIQQDVATCSSLAKYPLANATTWARDLLVPFLQQLRKPHRPDIQECCSAYIASGI